MTIRTIMLLLLGFIILISGCARAEQLPGLADQLPGLDGDPDNPEPTRNISAEENYSPVISAVYGSRDTFLFRASWEWDAQGNDLGAITLTEASNRGLLPFWILDPKTKNPVRILTSGEPTGSDVVLLSDIGGLGCKLIHGNRIDNPDAEPTIFDFNSFVGNVFDKLPAEDVAEMEERRRENIPTDWAVMMAGLDENIKRIFLISSSTHQAMPESMEQLLDGNFFINQDFLDFAKSLIDAGVSSHYECGIVPDENILYFDHELQPGLWYPVTYKYEAGFDIFEAQRGRIEKPWPQGLPEFENRIVLLSDEMLADPEQHFSSDITRPLSDFYTEN